MKSVRLLYIILFLLMAVFITPIRADGNGALTRDSNRGITGITYDYGHHPKTISWSVEKKHINNDYTPDGRKLSSQHVTFTPAGLGSYRRIITNDLYIDGLILRGGKPLMWQFDGGYVSLDANGTPTCWNYYVTDHLGSTRKVVDSNDNVKETISYYPFGSEMKMQDPAQMAGDTWQPYRFTGKELDNQNGLNWYDFGARWFDVAGVPMWTSVDPLAEKYYNITPYSYCMGNPVMFIDPDGRAPGDFFKTLDLAAKDFGKYTNPLSFKNKREYSTSFYTTKNDKGETGYSYTQPRKGAPSGATSYKYISRSNGVVTDTNKRTNEKAVATGHTHGAYDEEMGLGNDVFSGISELRGKDDAEARKKIKDKGKDIGSSNDAALQDYLVTPCGTLQHYDPSTGKIRIVDTEMPKDNNDKYKTDDVKQFYGQK